MHNNEEIKRLKAEQAAALQQILQLCISHGSELTPEERVKTIETICAASMLQPEEKLQAIEMVLRYFKSNLNINPNSVIDMINKELRAMGLNPLT